MHCAFALMIGIPGALLARHTLTRVLWCIYPFFVLFVVVVTANHFWLDARRRRAGGGHGGDGGAVGPGPGSPGGLVLPARHGLSPDDPLGSRRYAEPGLVAALFGAFYLVLQPSSADHAAQVFRSGLFESEGLSAWNNLWFGGHHTPGYSVLFPFLGSLIGPAAGRRDRAHRRLAPVRRDRLSRVGGACPPRRDLVRGRGLDQPLQRPARVRPRRRDRARGRVRLAARLEAARDRLRRPLPVREPGGRRSSWPAAPVAQALAERSRRGLRARRRPRSGRR